MCYLLSCVICVCYTHALSLSTPFLSCLRRPDEGVFVGAPRQISVACIVSCPVFLLLLKLHFHAGQATLTHWRPPGQTRRCIKARLRLCMPLQPMLCCCTQTCLPHRVPAVCLTLFLTAAFDLCSVGCVKGATVTIQPLSWYSLFLIGRSKQDLHLHLSNRCIESMHRPLTLSILQSDF